MATYGIWKCRILGTVGKRKMYYEAKLIDDRGAEVKKVRIEINLLNQGWGEGGVVSFYGKAKMVGKGGDKMVITPISKEEAMDVFSKEFEDYDSVLSSNASFYRLEDFLFTFKDRYLLLAKLLGKEKYARDKIKKAERIVQEHGGEKNG